jgi:phosphate starvation-inducible PhoH-like protein
MNKKTSEKRTRTRKKDNNSLSAFSETITEVNSKPNLQNIIHFFQPFKCKTKTQKDLINLINEKEMVIASGPAGVGKSYVTIARALELLKSTTTPFSKILISKPAVEAEEKHGFIPGDIREKMDPFIGSSLDIFDKLIGKNNRLWLEEAGYLEVQPLAYIRGKSIDNTILIMEEAQNMSPSQMKTLLTRIGENSKFIISGDLDQSDRYQNVTKSGLYDAIQKHKTVSEIGFIEFSEDEIVRNPLITKILGNYKKREKITNTEVEKQDNPTKKSFLKKVLESLK